MPLKVALILGCLAAFSVTMSLGKQKGKFQTVSYVRYLNRTSLLRESDGELQQ